MHAATILPAATHVLKTTEKGPSTLSPDFCPPLVYGALEGVKRATARPPRREGGRGREGGTTGSPTFFFASLAFRYGRTSVDGGRISTEHKMFKPAAAWRPERSCRRPNLLAGGEGGGGGLSCSRYRPLIVNGKKTSSVASLSSSPGCSDREEYGKNHQGTFCLRPPM